MDDNTARERLRAEHERINELPRQTTADANAERASSTEQGDMTDPAEPLVAQQEAEAVARGLRERLDAIERAQRRLDDGTYGRSIRSGREIPDERLEADPAAELTVDEL